MNHEHIFVTSTHKHVPFLRHIFPIRKAIKAMMALNLQNAFAKRLDIRHTQAYECTQNISIPLGSFLASRRTITYFGLQFGQRLLTAVEIEFLLKQHTTFIALSSLIFSHSYLAVICLSGYFNFSNLNCIEHRQTVTIVQIKMSLP